jgi:hypothetical protein
MASTPAEFQFPVVVVIKSQHCILARMGSLAMAEGVIVTCCQKAVMAPRALPHSTTEIEIIHTADVRERITNLPELRHIA